MPAPEKSAGQVIAVFGGRSEIGLEIATRLAPGNIVVLAARPGRMDAQRHACLDAGATEAIAVQFDADDTDKHDEVVGWVEDHVGPIDVALLTFGVLGDQELAERDHQAVVDVLHTDFVAQASLLTVLANRMRTRGRGTLVAFSSVAGQRVRRANYVYGSAKAGLDGFASGLADALHGTGVRLIIARPGFVIGRMTEGMQPAIFPSTPDTVADAVAASIRDGHEVELWIPWQLRVMFAIARWVPRSIWRKMPR